MSTSPGPAPWRIFPLLLVCLHLSALLATSSICRSHGNIYGGQNWRLYRHCIHNRIGDLISFPVTCTKRQYFDIQEGRCLGIPGGGFVVFVDTSATCNTVGLLPHPTQARYYLVCKSHKVIVAQCSKQEVFNQDKNHCDRRHVALSSEENEQYVSRPTCKSIGEFPAPNDCYAYYKCSSNGKGFVLTEYKCPNNAPYNITLKKCDSKSECFSSVSSLGKESDKNSPKCIKAGRFVVHLDCTMYRMCSPGFNEGFIQEYFFCPSGYVYDPVLEDCVLGNECIQAEAVTVTPIIKEIETTTMKTDIEEITTDTKSEPLTELPAIQTHSQSDCKLTKEKFKINDQTKTVHSESIQEPVEGNLKTAIKSEPKEDIKSLPQINSPPVKTHGEVEETTVAELKKSGQILPPKNPHYNSKHSEEKGKSELDEGREKFTYTLPSSIPKLGEEHIKMGIEKEKLDQSVSHGCKHGEENIQPEVNAKPSTETELQSKYKNVEEKVKPDIKKETEKVVPTISYAIIKQDEGNIKLGIKKEPEKTIQSGQQPGCKFIEGIFLPDLRNEPKKQVLSKPDSCSQKADETFSLKKPEKVIPFIPQSGGKQTEEKVNPTLQKEPQKLIQSEMKSDLDQSKENPIPYAEKVNEKLVQAIQYLGCKHAEEEVKPIVEKVPQNIIHTFPESGKEELKPKIQEVTEKSIPSVPQAVCKHAVEQIKSEVKKQPEKVHQLASEIPVATSVTSSYVGFKDKEDKLELISPTKPKKEEEIIRKSTPASGCKFEELKKENTHFTESKKLLATLTEDIATSNCKHVQPINIVNEPKKSAENITNIPKYPCKIPEEKINTGTVIEPKISEVTVPSSIHEISKSESHTSIHNIQKDTVGGNFGSTAKSGCNFSEKVFKLTTVIGSKKATDIVPNNKPVIVDKQSKTPTYTEKKESIKFPTNISPEQCNQNTPNGEPKSSGSPVQKHEGLTERKESETTTEMISASPPHSECKCKDVGVMKKSEPASEFHSNKLIQVTTPIVLDAEKDLVKGVGSEAEPVVIHSLNPSIHAPEMGTTVSELPFKTITREEQAEFTVEPVKHTHRFEESSTSKTFPNDKVAQVSGPLVKIQNTDFFRPIIGVPSTIMQSPQAAGILFTTIPDISEQDSHSSKPSTLTKIIDTNRVSKSSAATYVAKVEPETSTVIIPSVTNEELKSLNKLSKDPQSAKTQSELIIGMTETTALLEKTKNKPGIELHTSSSEFKEDKIDLPPQRETYLPPPVTVKYESTTKPGTLEEHYKHEIVSSINDYNKKQPYTPIKTEIDTELPKEFNLGHTTVSRHTYQVTQLIDTKGYTMSGASKDINSALATKEVQGQLGISSGDNSVSQEVPKQNLKKFNNIQDQLKSSASTITDKSLPKHAGYSSFKKHSEPDNIVLMTNTPNILMDKKDKLFSTYLFNAGTTTQLQENTDFVIKEQHIKELDAFLKTEPKTSESTKQEHKKTEEDTRNLSTTGIFQSSNKPDFIPVTNSKFSEPAEISPQHMHKDALYNLKNDFRSSDGGHASLRKSDLITTLYSKGQTKALPTAFTIKEDSELLKGYKDRINLDQVAQISSDTKLHLSDKHYVPTSPYSFRVLHSTKQLQTEFKPEIESKDTNVEHSSKLLSTYPGNYVTSEIPIVKMTKVPIHKTENDLAVNSSSVTSVANKKFEEKKEFKWSSHHMLPVTYSTLSPTSQKSLDEHLKITENIGKETLQKPISLSTETDKLLQKTEKESRSKDNIMSPSEDKTVIQSIKNSPVLSEQIHSKSSEHFHTQTYPPVPPITKQPQKDVTTESPITSYSEFSISMFSLPKELIHSTDIPVNHSKPSSILLSNKEGKYPVLINNTFTEKFAEGDKVKMPNDVTSIFHKESTSTSGIKPSKPAKLQETDFSYSEVMKNVSEISKVKEAEINHVTLVKNSSHSDGQYSTLFDETKIPELHPIISKEKDSELSFTKVTEAPVKIGNYPEISTYSSLSPLLKNIVDKNPDFVKLDRNTFYSQEMKQLTTYPVRETNSTYTRSSHETKSSEPYHKMNTPSPYAIPSVENGFENNRKKQSVRPAENDKFSRLYSEIGTSKISDTTIQSEKSNPTESLTVKLNKYEFSISSAHSTLSPSMKIQEQKYSASENIKTILHPSSTSNVTIKDEKIAETTLKPIEQSKYISLVGLPISQKDTETTTLKTKTTTEMPSFSSQVVIKTDTMELSSNRPLNQENGISIQQAEMVTRKATMITNFQSPFKGQESISNFNDMKVASTVERTMLNPDKKISNAKFDSDTIEKTVNQINLIHPKATDFRSSGLVAPSFKKDLGEVLESESSHTETLVTALGRTPRSTIAEVNSPIVSSTEHESKLHTVEGTTFKSLSSIKSRPTSHYSSKPVSSRDKEVFLKYNNKTGIYSSGSELNEAVFLPTNSSGLHRSSASEYSTATTMGKYTLPQDKDLTTLQLSYSTFKISSELTSNHDSKPPSALIHSIKSTDPENSTTKLTSPPEKHKRTTSRLEGETGITFTQSFDMSRENSIKQSEMHVPSTVESGSFKTTMIPLNLSSNIFSRLTNAGVEIPSYPSRTMEIKTSSTLSREVPSTFVTAHKDSIESFNSKAELKKVLSDSKTGVSKPVTDRSTVSWNSSSSGTSSYSPNSRRTVVVTTNPLPSNEVTNTVYTSNKIHPKSESLSNISSELISQTNTLLPNAFMSKESDMSYTLAKTNKENIVHTSRTTSNDFARTTAQEGFSVSGITEKPSKPTETSPIAHLSKNISVVEPHKPNALEITPDYTYEHRGSVLKQIGKTDMQSLGSEPKEAVLRPVSSVIGKKEMNTASLITLKPMRIMETTLDSYNLTTKSFQPSRPIPSIQPSISTILENPVLNLSNLSFKSVEKTPFTTSMMYTKIYTNNITLSFSSDSKQVSYSSSTRTSDGPYKSKQTPDAKPEHIAGATTEATNLNTKVTLIPSTFSLNKSPFVTGIGMQQSDTPIKVLGADSSSYKPRVSDVTNKPISTANELSNVTMTENSTKIITTSMAFPSNETKLQKEYGVTIKPTKLEVTESSIATTLSLSEINKSTIKITTDPKHMGTPTLPNPSSHLVTVKSTANSTELSGKYYSNHHSSEPSTSVLPIKRVSSVMTRESIYNQTTVAELDSLGSENSEVTHKGLNLTMNASMSINPAKTTLTELSTSFTPPRSSYIKLSDPSVEPKLEISKTTVSFSDGISVTSRKPINIKEVTLSGMDYSNHNTSDSFTRVLPTKQISKIMTGESIHKQTTTPDMHSLGSENSEVTHKGLNSAMNMSTSIHPEKTPSTELSTPSTPLRTSYVKLSDPTVKLELHTTKSFADKISVTTSKPINIKEVTLPGTDYSNRDSSESFTSVFPTKQSSKVMTTKSVYRQTTRADLDSLGSENNEVTHKGLNVTNANTSIHPAITPLIQLTTVFTPLSSSKIKLSDSTLKPKVETSNTIISKSFSEEISVTASKPINIDEVTMSSVLNSTSKTLLSEYSSRTTETSHLGYTGTVTNSTELMHTSQSTVKAHSRTSVTESYRNVTPSVLTALTELPSTIFFHGTDTGISEYTSSGTENGLIVSSGTDSNNHRLPHRAITSTLQTFRTSASNKVKNATNMTSFTSGKISEIVSMKNSSTTKSNLSTVSQSNWPTVMNSSTDDSSTNFKTITSSLKDSTEYNYITQNFQFLNSTVPSVVPHLVTKTNIPKDGTEGKSPSLSTTSSSVNEGISSKQSKLATEEHSEATTKGLVFTTSVSLLTSSDKIDSTHHIKPSKVNSKQTTETRTSTLTETSILNSSEVKFQPTELPQSKANQHYSSGTITTPQHTNKPSKVSAGANVSKNTNISGDTEQSASEIKEFVHPSVNSSSKNSEAHIVSKQTLQPHNTTATNLILYNVTATSEPSSYSHIKSSTGVTQVETSTMSPISHRTSKMSSVVEEEKTRAFMVTTSNTPNTTAISNSVLPYITPTNNKTDHVTIQPPKLTVTESKRISNSKTTKALLISDFTEATILPSSGANYLSTRQSQNKFNQDSSSTVSKQPEKLLNSAKHSTALKRMETTSGATEPPSSRITQAVLTSLNSTDTDSQTVTNSKHSYTVTSQPPVLNNTRSTTTPDFLKYSGSSHLLSTGTEKTTAVTSIASSVSRNMTVIKNYSSLISTISMKHTTNNISTQTSKSVITNSTLYSTSTPSQSSLPLASNTPSSKVTSSTTSNNRSSPLVSQSTTIQPVTQSGRMSSMDETRTTTVQTTTNNLTSTNVTVNDNGLFHSSKKLSMYSTEGYSKATLQPTLQTSKSTTKRTISVIENIHDLESSGTDREEVILPGPSTNKTYSEILDLSTNASRLPEFLSTTVRATVSKEVGTFNTQSNILNSKVRNRGEHVSTEVTDRKLFTTQITQVPTTHLKSINESEIGKSIVTESSFIVVSNYTYNKNTDGSPKANSGGTLKPSLDRTNVTTVVQGMSPNFVTSPKEKARNVSVYSTGSTLPYSNTFNMSEVKSISNTVTLHSSTPRPVSGSTATTLKSSAITSGRLSNTISIFIPTISNKTLNSTSSPIFSSKLATTSRYPSSIISKITSEKISSTTNITTDSRVHTSSISSTQNSSKSTSGFTFTKYSINSTAIPLSSSIANNISTSFSTSNGSTKSTNRGSGFTDSNVSGNRSTYSSMIAPLSTSFNTNNKSSSFVLSTGTYTSTVVTPYNSVNNPSAKSRSPSVTTPAIRSNVALFQTEKPKRPLEVGALHSYDTFQGQNHTFNKDEVRKSSVAPAVEPVLFQTERTIKGPVVMSLHLDHDPLTSENSVHNLKNNTTGSDSKGTHQYSGLQSEVSPQLQLNKQTKEETVKNEPKMHYNKLPSEVKDDKLIRILGSTSTSDNVKIKEEFSTLNTAKHDVFSESLNISTSSTRDHSTQDYLFISSSTSRKETVPIFSHVENNIKTNMSELFKITVFPFNRTNVPEYFSTENKTAYTMDRTDGPIDKPADVISSASGVHITSSYASSLSTSIMKNFSQSTSMFSAHLPPCEEIGSFRVPNTCHYYYECQYHGIGEIVQSSVKKCTGCLVFNSNIGVCDFPENVPECSQNSKAQNCTGEGTFAVPGSVNKYHVCKKNATGYIIKERKECVKNHVYNAKTGVCVLRESVNNYQSINNNIIECKKRGFFSHPYNCNKFVHCVHTEKNVYISEVKRCPPRLYFNEVGGYCDHPENILTVSDSYSNDI